VDVGRRRGRGAVLILPAALGCATSIDAGLARVLFSWTLHAIVYFWLMPAYIAFYTIVPRAIGGRLYSDTMGRVAFVLFLVFSMPIGIITRSPIRRSGRLQVRARGDDGDGVGADAAHRLHDRRLRRDRRRACAAARAPSAG
jgi:hypothetical protein